MPHNMPHLHMLIMCALLCPHAEAAIEHFMVTADADAPAGIEPQTCDQALADSDHTPEGAMSFDELQQSGIIDSKLLIQALMQQVQMMGLDISQFDESDLLDSADEQLSYQEEQPSWYDVFSY